jgi:plastocyanin domain-containing protein
MAIGSIGAAQDTGVFYAGGADRAAANQKLTPEEQQQVQKLRQIDRQVRAHEAAHKAAGAGLTGAVTYEFVRGPDGRQYAVAGEVSIDVSPAQTPEQTIAKAKRIQAAALAPADPSSQDRAVAAQAAQMAAMARIELSRENKDESAAARNIDNVNGADNANSATSSRESRAVAAYTNLEPQPESLLSLFA